jgi:hypothetical protein
MVCHWCGVCFVGYVRGVSGTCNASSNVHANAVFCVFGSCGICVL